MKRLAYKFRLKPHARQRKKLHQFAGCARFVYNKALSLEQEQYKQTKKMLGYNKIAKLLVGWKRTAEFGFLKNTHSQILQQKLQDLYTGFDNFFAHRADHPRYKKKGLHDSFRYPQGFKIDEAGKRIYLPKIGHIAYYQSRLITGTPKNITVSYSAGHWYCSIQTEQEQIIAQHPSASIIGIDVGIARFATLSDGTIIEPINSLRSSQNKIKRLQRSVSRKKKGSFNRKKALRKLIKIHQRIAYKRHDYLHKITTTISKNHARVVIEDLQITNMSASARGTRDNPGKNIKAKAGLNTSILDQAWHEFRRQLVYKLAWAGGELILVPAHRTSQTCSSCGFVHADNRKTQQSFLCLQCGYDENADLNAAKNILSAGIHAGKLTAAGHAVIACGEKAIGRSLKQEPIPSA